MARGSTFDKELYKLADNEDNIEAVREILLKDINNTFDYKLKIDKLLKFSKENNLSRSEAWGYYYLGWHHFDISEYEKAVNKFLISYDLFDKLNNSYEIAYACNGLTNAYCRMGQYKLSNEWGLKGISFCDDTGNKEAMIILLLNTCTNYIQMEYYDKALDMLESIEEMDYILNTTQKISYLLSKAEIEINIGNPENAFEIIDKAMKIESDAKLNADISEMLKLKGKAYLKTGKYDLAEEQFKSSFDISAKYDLMYEKCSAMLEWSKLYMITENYEEAIKLLDEIIIISSSKKYNHIMREAFHSLYLVYKRQDKTEKALQYLEEYTKVDDVMYDYEQSQLMAKMSLNYVKRTAEQYKRLATYDQLTKFLTKLEIQKIGYKVFEGHKDKKTKFSLMMMDLDNFKDVNDTYGHIYGDKAMSIVGEVITKSIRNTDYIGRFGGDEFLLICPGAGIKEAFEVAERIRKALESHLFILSDEVSVKLTVSIGVHEYSEEDNSFTDMLKKADKCLYKAKETRNKVCAD